MPTYTPNYRLHQWVETDPFLRTDFNQDLAIIDTALKAASEQSGSAAAEALETAQRALTGLEKQSYNLYNLMLERYYEGKTDGWRRAMVFDGFQDESLISQKSATLRVDKEERCLILSGDEVDQIDGNYGKEFSKTLADGETARVVWTATSTATVTGVVFQITKGGGRVSVTGPEGEDLGSATLSNGTAALFFPIEFEKAYTFQFTAKGETELWRRLGSDPFGFLLRVKDAAIIPGSLRSSHFVLGERYPHVRSWLRCSHLEVPRNPRMRIDVGGEMTEAGWRNSTTLSGRSCKELEFSLTPSWVGNISFTVCLELATRRGVDLKIYDYGVVVI